MEELLRKAPDRDVTLANLYQGSQGSAAAGNTLRAVAVQEGSTQVPVRAVEEDRARSNSNCNRAVAICNNPAAEVAVKVGKNRSSNPVLRMLRRAVVKALRDSAVRVLRARDIKSSGRSNRCKLEVETCRKVPRVAGSVEKVVTNNSSRNRPDFQRRRAAVDNKPGVVPDLAVHAPRAKAIKNNDSRQCKAGPAECLTKRAVDADSASNKCRLRVSDNKGVAVASVGNSRCSSNSIVSNSRCRSSSIANSSSSNSSSRAVANGKKASPRPRLADACANGILAMIT